MTCQREKELLEQIEQTGQMYKVSALQLIKAGKRIAELESLNGALCRDNAGFVQERDQLLLGDEGAKEVFGVLVEQKHALEEEIKQMRRTIDVQQGIIRALQRTQPAMPANPRNGEWPTLDHYKVTCSSGDAK